MPGNASPPGVPTGVPAPRPSGVWGAAYIIGLAFGVAGGKKPGLCCGSANPFVSSLARFAAGGGRGAVEVIAPSLQIRVRRVFYSNWRRERGMC